MIELIKTENSCLKVMNLEDNINLQEIINTIKDKLIENPEIMVFGKRCNQHRSIGFFSDTSVGYYYSKQLAKSQPLNELKQLLDIINVLFGIVFDGILVNRYKDGEDYISAHSDDEKGLTDAGVIILSFGATRKFRIRDKNTKKIVLDVPLLSGQIIQMSGNFQKEFTHEIPIEKRVKGERYSFTFRQHLY